MYGGPRFRKDPLNYTREGVISVAGSCRLRKWPNCQNKTRRNVSGRSIA